MAPERAHSILSRMHIASHAPGMPLHTHLQRLCSRSPEKARSFQGLVAGCKTDLSLSSVGRQRIRSCAMSRDIRSFADIHSHRCSGPDVVRSVEPGDPMPGSYGTVWYSVGIHPWNTGSAVGEAEYAELERLAADPRVVAVGECGLDALRGGASDVQEAAFLRQAAIAEKVAKPLIIHCVRRYGRLMELHHELKPRQLWIVHGFRGKPELARQLAAAGIGISLGIPRPDIAAVVPPPLLFAETD